MNESIEPNLQYKVTEYRFIINNYQFEFVELIQLQLLFK